MGTIEEALSIDARRAVEKERARLELQKEMERQRIRVQAMVIKLKQTQIEQETLSRLDQIESDMRKDIQEMSHSLDQSVKGKFGQKITDSLGKLIKM